MLTIERTEGECTLDEIGTALGLSRERVRQIEATALKKLRLTMALEALLGPTRAAPLLENLRGKSVGTYRDAYRAAKESA